MDENNETQSQTADAAGLDTPTAPSSAEQQDRESEADADTVAAEETDALDEDSEDEEDDDEDDEDSEDEDSEDEDDEDSEDEDSEDEDDDEDEEEYEPIDFWSVPEICAFGDDLECKFDVRLLGEIAEAADDHELVSPISEGNNIVWVNPSNWRNPREFMEEIGAESDTEQRIDRELWTEIVEIWKWEPWIGTHIDINADPEWEPWQRKAAEQARAYQIELDARKFSRTDMDEVLKNLLRQTAVIQRELLRTTLTEELAELAELEGASEPDDEAIARYRDYIAQSRKAVEEASQRCRELRTID